LWLEQWLQSYQGTLLMISHDRDFLDATVDHIVHLANQQLTMYTGNYSQFETQRASYLLMQQSIYEKQQRQLAHMQSFVDRFRYKATKARQAQSRLKAIERMELVCAVQSEVPFQFEFMRAKNCPSPLVAIEKARISYGNKIVLDNISLTITPKDRLAILGPNGAGKSSFIKLLAGELAASGGSIEHRAGVVIGYFAQHQIDHLQLNDTPLLHLRRLAPTHTEIELRKFLGSFGFPGDDVFAPVKNFSGGEKSRLALALLVWQKPNLLLLDEPTNHLDMDMRHALSIALQDYEGAMILVSHDRFLVRSTADQLLLAADGKLEEFSGDLDDYHRWLINYRKEQKEPTKGVSAQTRDTNLSAKEKRQQAAKEREAQRPLQQKIEQSEKKLQRLQAEIIVIENKLTDQSLYLAENKAELQKQLEALTAKRKTLSDIEEEWLAACELRDQEN
jgi:ATP-binding cassette subfamily F protein 3